MILFILFFREMDKLFRIFIGLACLMLATGQGIAPGVLNVRFMFCLLFCPTSRPPKFTNRLTGVIDQIKKNFYTSADRLCQFSVRLPDVILLFRR